MHGGLQRLLKKIGASSFASGLAQIEIAIPVKIEHQKLNLPFSRLSADSYKNIKQK